ncbi:hypothetical protein EDB85DRAFT_1904694 [Lactarius pseudohatsudake]|nr:hypothetical protein EDB85DRAFT_1904694 [Lactarius pseudohatsudake]
MEATRQLQRDGDKGSATRAVWRWTKAIQGAETGIGRFRGERPSYLDSIIWSVEKSLPSTSPLNIPFWPLGPWAPEPDCPLCLLGNSQAAPSYRWLIRWAVGDLLPEAEASEGGEITGALACSTFSFVRCSYHFRPTLSWTHEPRVPPAHSKLKGAGVCTARARVTGAAPLAIR